MYVSKNIACYDKVESLNRLMWNNELLKYSYNFTYLISMHLFIGLHLTLTITKSVSYNTHYITHSHALNMYNRSYNANQYFVS